MKFTLEQKKHVVIYLHRHPDEPLSYAKIAFDLNMPTTVIRYMLADMEKEGIISRTITKAYNKHYIRYTYRVQKLDTFISKKE